MSRTQIYRMENNRIINPAIFGFNANDGSDGGASFEFLYNNKEFENEKQYNTLPDFDLLSELNDQSFYNVNNNENSSLNNNEDSTYTLDNLLELVGDLPENDFTLESPLDFPTVKSDGLYTEMIMDTALASPVSSLSSEESYSLDDLLFNNQNPEMLENTNLGIEITEVIESSNTPCKGEIPDNNTTHNLPDNLSDLSQLNGCDFDAIFNLLLQSQSSEKSIEESIPNEMVTDILPIPSESESEDVRYTPYTKGKKKKTPEQRQRKKVQNRNAASRYRVKKKDQFDAMNLEADQLEEKNNELKGKVEGLRTEIDYLKNLMLDVIKARLAKGTLTSNLLSLPSEGNLSDNLLSLVNQI